MKITKAVRDLLENAIRAHFSGTTISSITMKEVEGFDGNPLLKVTVVYETSTGLIDAKKASSLGLMVRPALKDNDIDAFPIFSYISKAETGRSGART